ncbi:hypothetical protein [Dietzia sp. WMMA184]|uniref:phosphoribosyltransferase-like protein n=1 Tax=Dietzia sp. WMMA184 TaxID=2039808 RepID=UPI001178CC68|nr:hypothetical protein [Dietzia sp. WMMA184]
MNLDDLKSSRRYLSHIGVWPKPQSLDVDGWLDNFDNDTDQEIAAALLDSYVHLNEDQITHAVAAAVRSLSAESRFGTPQERHDLWGDYLGSVRISFPQSRPGDTTGSGYIFARIANKQLGFREDQISQPEILVKYLAARNEKADLLLLDDLAASGKQFVRSWSCKYRTDNGKFSLADLENSGKVASAYFLPVVATEDAKKRIEQETPVKVVPTYVLTSDYGGLATNSRLFPRTSQHELLEFLNRYTPRTGKNEHGVAGYGDIGLALSFHHGCPNNTLPILQWGDPQPDWKPLVS